MSVNKTNEIKSYLSFRLSEEIFAANVYKVLNILEMRTITKIPQAPDYMKGVINLRGNVLPVVDLRIKFGLPITEITVDTCIIVLNINLDGGSIMVGALVDAVKEVLELNDEDIEPAPSIGTKYNANFIQGMYRVNENFVMILNIDHVFNTDELINVNETADKLNTEEIKE
ncbi:MAG: chemotaxis protein CheW [Bacteroidetes bacterium GWE2_29_8]|nr:MAG: chemotaxis protein CheW [Bacteroidetes bacterium GWE2_29_8]OFY20117.1 MAG: chemotaxis protein CheW [Bacteroidetes bacterium GWF2_29_10]